MVVLVRDPLALGADLLTLVGEYVVSGVDYLVAFGAPLLHQCGGHHMFVAARRWCWERR